MASARPSMESESMLMSALAVSSVLPSPEAFQRSTRSQAYSQMAELPYNPLVLRMGLKHRNGAGSAPMARLQDAVVARLSDLHETVESTLGKLRCTAERLAVQAEKLLTEVERRVPRGFALPQVSRPPSQLRGYAFAAIIPGDSAAEIVVASSILNFLNIYNTLIVCRLILTWFPSAPEVIVSPLSTLCDPYLNIFRGLIPPIGGTLDLSPILAFLTLNVFTSTAAALPAELPLGEGAIAPRPLSWRQKAQRRLGLGVNVTEKKEA